MIDMTIQGDQQLERKLLSLERKVAKKVVRKAGRKALRPILSSAKQNAKTMVGGEMGTLLAAALILRAFRKQRKSSYGLNVRLKAAIQEFIHIAKDGTRYYIPAAIEYGHDSAAAIPFMRAAFEANRGKTIVIMKDEIWKGIKLEARIS